MRITNNVTPSQPPPPTVPRLPSSKPCQTSPESVPRTKISADVSDSISSTWDGWPDGLMHLDLTNEQMADTGNLKIHWATRGNQPRKNRKNYNALSWQEGSIYIRKCLGVIVCTGDDCSYVVRPTTRGSDALERLASQPCEVCHSDLYHISCDVQATTYTWADGVHFYNDGFHDHPRPSLPTLTDPGETARDISEVYNNPARVSRDRHRIIQSSDPGGEKFLTSFSAFCKKHPSFVIHSVIGEVSVITVQTDFMRQNLVKDSALDGPINGIVNDATHTFWKEKNALLMISSTYCPVLFCWVPGVMSYMNGGTEDHFKHHFFALLRTMSFEADDRQIDVVDRMFAGVCFYYYKLMGNVLISISVDHGLQYC
ncbi:hypothetical protein CPC08DRAFT_810019 [Agrocybe pediades]|nr:hypothetical protein CPC08DRAFT_810019 [Agrocybe pediades]